jgi:C4-dicarboxylate-specific signal transduction histidine kinase
MKLGDSVHVRPYLLALALCFLALPVARALDAPSSCFILAVMAASLYAGRGPALAATLLSSCAFLLFFATPALHILHSQAAFLRFGVFVGAMLLTTELVETKKRSERARRAAEESLWQIQGKLAKAAQIAAVSELSASVAHEISQPLSAMLANGQACLRWLDATPPRLPDARAAAERIVRDGKDAGEVIKGLRSLFQQSPPEKKRLDISQLILEIVSLMRDRAERDGVALELHLADNLPPVLGDTIQLQQVLVNLMTNGMDAMGSVVDRPKRLAIRARQESGTVLIEIEDAGTGILNLDTIFDSFVTTKKGGLGMGLSICRSIVQAHAGRLWAAPSPAGGAIFTFTVPVVPATVPGGELAA